MKKITAMITAYNVEKYIQRSIDSVLNQTIKPFEIIVIDDGSMDNTANLVQAYGNRVKYIHKKNGGASSARNIGIHEAKGDWIAFLDADDEWMENHLENFMRVLKYKEDLMWFGAPVEHVDEQTKKSLFKYKQDFQKNFIGKPFFDDYLSAIPPLGFFSTPTMIINKSVFNQVGFFDESKNNGEDRDMWFRIGLLFPPIGYTGKTGAIVYKRNNSLSRTKTVNVKSVVEQYRNYISYAQSLGEQYHERAKPRIQDWTKRTLKSSISRGEYNSIILIYNKLRDYIPMRYKFLTKIIQIFPFVLRYKKNKGRYIVC